MTTKKIFSTLLITAVIFVFSACSEKELSVPPVPVTDVTLNESTLTLVVDETEVLIATVTPDNADNQTVTWKSSNDAVAIVSNAGVVTAISAGMAIITAQAGEKTATCAVTVIDPIANPAGVVIDGIRWATRNVNAPGTFADNPQDAGMFYQWNRRIGWSTTNPMTDSNGGTTWDPSTPAGTAWHAENDPCPIGWRVPDIDELRSLHDARSEWVTDWNNTGVNGRIFGTAPNQIFLPAVGWRGCCSGALSAAGTGGGYWSSTQGGSTDARDLLFHSGSVSVNWFSRSNGLSVRCVAD